MIARIITFAAALCVVVLTGCGSRIPGIADAPAQAAGGSQIEASAHRPLAPAAAAQRAPDALSAFPAPLSAFPAPLSAFPAIGQAPAQTTSALCSLTASGPVTGPGPGGPAKGPGPGGPPAGPGGPPAGPGGPAGCHVLVRTDVPLLPSSTPAQLLNGMLPGWIQQIYNLPPLDVTSGSTSTVAIVVAFDDPVAEADLAVYRNTFGLPPCTTANGCFTKLAEDGSTNYPAENAGWAVETSTDVDTVSAVCPGCKIMVVEAASSNIPDLAAAVDTAAAHGATVISNSYGVPEASDNVQYDSHYNHPGIAVVASAGDRGYGVMFPASSEYVTAVGGTTLYQTNGGVSEAAWPQTNAGCSAFIPKPHWQHDTGCPNRTMNDVAVVADPATGMAVYDSILNGNSGGWTVVGGTSIGAPIVSSIIAMGPHPNHYDSPQQLYNHQNQFFQITAGADGTCTPSYLCTAGPAPGYSGPVGVGSPNGNQAFKN